MPCTLPLQSSPLLGSFSSAFTGVNQGVCERDQINFALVQGNARCIAGSAFDQPTHFVNGRLDQVKGPTSQAPGRISC